MAKSTTTETCSAAPRSRRNCSSDGAERTHASVQWSGHTFITAVQTLVDAVQHPLHQNAAVVAARVERRSARIRNCSNVTTNHSVSRWTRATSSTPFNTQNGGNVTSAGWQVTLCDPGWTAQAPLGCAHLHSSPNRSYNRL